MAPDLFITISIAALISIVVALAVDYAQRHHAEWTPQLATEGAAPTTRRAKPAAPLRAEDPPPPPAPSTSSAAPGRAAPAATPAAPRVAPSNVRAAPVERPAAAERDASAVSGLRAVSAAAADVVLNEEENGGAVIEPQPLATNATQASGMAHADLQAAPGPREGEPAVSTESGDSEASSADTVVMKNRDEIDGPSTDTESWATDSNHGARSMTRPAESASLARSAHLLRGDVEERMRDHGIENETLIAATADMSQSTLLWAVKAVASGASREDMLTAGSVAIESALRRVPEDHPLHIAPTALGLAVGNAGHGVMAPAHITEPELESESESEPDPDDNPLPSPPLDDVVPAPGDVVPAPGDESDTHDDDGHVETPSDDEDRRP